VKTVASIVVLGLGLGVGAYAADGSRSSVFTLPSGVTIRIVEGPFNPAKHKIKGCTEAAGADGCFIDGRFGSADELPKTYVKSITATFGGRSYSLDVSQMYNAWGGRPLEVKGVVRYFGGSCSDPMNCTLRGLFSDAAGSYVAEWQIANGISARTILTWSGDIVSEFITNIDPPEYD
jgi:hypothetical protein